MHLVKTSDEVKKIFLLIDEEIAKHYKDFFFYLIQVVACCNFELFCELIKPNDLYPNQNRVITD